MQSSVNVEISLFGAFRKFATAIPYEFTFQQGSQVREVRQALLDEIIMRYPYFDQHQLVEKSVLADDNEILGDDYVLKQSVKLAILPPVCGG